MKLKYKFATETIEIHVSEKWGPVLRELNREEYNINHKETRRHESYSHNTDKQEDLEDMDVDIEADFIRSCEVEVLHKAIKDLLPQQQELIHRVFFEGRTISSIARDENVDESAVRDRLKRIYEKIKKSLK